MSQQDRRESTRTKLLDAAEEALLECGYAAFTLADVASRAGVTTGAVQRHFSTKQGLLLAVFDRAAERQLQAAGRLWSESADAPLADRLREAMVQSWEALDLKRLQLLDQLAQAALVDPVLYDSLLDHGRRSSQLITHQIATLLGPQFVDDPKLETALLVISLMFRGLAAGSTLSEPGEVQEFFEDTARLLVDGLRPQGALQPHDGQQPHDPAPRGQRPRRR